MSLTNERVVSLLELMRRFYAQAFCSAGHLIGLVEGLMQSSTEKGTPKDHLDDEGRASITVRIDEIVTICRANSLNVSLAIASRIKADVAEKNLIFMSETVVKLANLYEVMSEELALSVFLQIPQEKLSKFESPLLGWEDQVQRFPSSQIDIEEAGKCLALGRNTAAVFHLMRALEPVLRRLAEHLSISKQSPTWNAYLTAFQKAVVAKYPGSSASEREWKAFFADTESHLHAIKTAWRNPTIHDFNRAYTDTQAEEIYVAVRGFVRAVSSRLSEVEPAPA